MMTVQNDNPVTSLVEVVQANSLQEESDRITDWFDGELAQRYGNLQLQQEGPIENVVALVNAFKKNMENTSDQLIHEAEQKFIVTTETICPSSMTVSQQQREQLNSRLRNLTSIASHSMLQSLEQQLTLAYVKLNEELQTCTSASNLLTQEAHELSEAIQQLKDDQQKLEEDQMKAIADTDSERWVLRWRSVASIAVTNAISLAIPAVAFGSLLGKCLYGGTTSFIAGLVAGQSFEDILKSTLEGATLACAGVGVANISSDMLQKGHRVASITTKASLDAVSGVVIKAATGGDPKVGIVSGIVSTVGAEFIDSQ
jgi:hypothetical protein